MSVSLPGGWYEENEQSRLTIFLQKRTYFASSSTSSSRKNSDSLSSKTKYKIVVKPWSTLEEVKSLFAIYSHVPFASQHLFYGTCELVNNSHTLLDYGIYKDNTILEYVVLPVGAQWLSKRHLRLCQVQTSMKLRILMQEAQLGMQLGFAPHLTLEGSGGTYLCRNPRQKNVVVFKPQDEEPFAPKNPRRMIGQLGGEFFLRKGILSGEAFAREVAAYILDKDHFAGVPATALVEAIHPAFNYLGEDPYLKLGSLQEFITYDDLVSDISSSKFSKRQVHKIVQLDIRLMNIDRHDGNILVRRHKRKPNVLTKSLSNNNVLNKNRLENGCINKPSHPGYDYELIPIDHGYCIPDTIEVAWCDWCWFNWPQLKEPLSQSDRSYILKLDIAKDVDNLSKQITLRPECKRVLLLSGLMLQKCLFYNEEIVLFDIVKLIAREDLDTPSIFETLISQADQYLNNELTKKLDHLHIEIDIKNDDADISDFYVCKSTPHKHKSVNTNGGPSSPLGFWASYDPFKIEDEDEVDFNNIISTTQWDDMANQALQIAATTVEKKETIKTSKVHDLDQHFFEIFDKFLHKELDRILDQKTKEKKNAIST